MWEKLIGGEEKRLNLFCWRQLYGYGCPTSSLSKHTHQMNLDVRLNTAHAEQIREGEKNSELSLFIDADCLSGPLQYCRDLRGNGRLEYERKYLIMCRAKHGEDVRL